ncbi:MAG: RNA methyltransferase, partial [Muribaculaceae bacterium]|nr:RNA methyltransferase [Muribaculaceae bacterium]
MEQNLVISSVKNERVKRVVELQQKSASRREAGLTVVEGVREICHCIDAGYEIGELYYCPSLCDINASENLYTHCPLYEVTREVYDKMAYRGSTEGIVAVVKTKNLHVSDLQLPANALIVVLESVEKPGNLGAVLRSADAAKVDAVVVCDPRCDIYNPNVI